MAEFHKMARAATRRSIRMVLHDSESSSDDESSTSTTKGTTEVSDSSTKKNCTPNEIHEAPSSPEPEPATASESAKVAEPATASGSAKVDEEDEGEVVDQNGRAVFKLKKEMTRDSGRRKLHSPTSNSSDEDSEIHLVHKVPGTPYSGYISFTTKYKNQPNSHPRVKRDGDACFERMSLFRDVEQDDHYEFDY